MKLINTLQLQSRSVNKLFFFIFGLSMAFFVVLPVQAATSSVPLAQSDTSTSGFEFGDLFGMDSISNGINLGNADLTTIIARLINVGLSFLGIILVVMILIGGFQWMFSGGNDEKTAAARRTIISAIIGLLIILLANSIVIFILKSLGSATGAPGVSNTESL